MAKMKGICRNVDGCDMAADKVVQEKEKSDFTCEECGKPLYPLKNNKQSNKKPLLIAVAVLVVLLAVAAWALLPGSGQGTDATVVADTTTVSLPATIIRSDTVVVRDTIVQDNTTTISEKTSTRTVINTTSTAGSNSTLTLSYGRYTGATKNGYPHGQGRLTYTTDRTISRYDTKARTAQSGDYVIGEFFNGFVVYGKHYDAQGNLLESLNFGVGPESSYETK